MKIKILQINNGCSANCLHCPYSSRKADNFRIESLLKKIGNSDYLLITGGEPMEHKEIEKITYILNQKNKYFRIATGGHIALKEYMHSITKFDFFCGFSIGTDIVIPERNPAKNLEIIWLENIKQLINEKVNYSITITFDSDFNLSQLVLFLQNNTKPDFVTLSEIHGKSIPSEKIADATKLISNSLGVKVLHGYRN